MDIEQALALTQAPDLLRAVQEAETRNCEHWVIQALNKKYQDAIRREQKAAWEKSQREAGRHGRKD